MQPYDMNAMLLGNIFCSSKCETVLEEWYIYIAWGGNNSKKNNGPSSFNSMPDLFSCAVDHVASRDKALNKSE